MNEAGILGRSMPPLCLCLYLGTVTVCLLNSSCDSNWKETGDVDVMHHRPNYNGRYFDSYVRLFKGRVHSKARSHSDLLELPLR